MIEQYKIDFIRVLKDWSTLNTTVACKYLVCKVDEKETAIYSEIVFGGLPLQEQRIETKKIIAGTISFPLTQEYLKKTISNIQEERPECVILTEKYFLPLNDKKNLGHNSSRMRLQDSVYPSYRSPDYWISGDRVSNSVPDWREVDLELRELPEPYEDVDDLLSSLDIPDDARDRHEPRIRYIIRAPIIKKSSEIKNNSELNISFTFPKGIEKEKFKVGLRIMYQNGQSNRFTVSERDLKWTNGDQQLHCNYTARLKDISMANVYPTYFGHNIGSEIVSNPEIIFNRRLAVDQIIFPKIDLLKDLTSKEATRFEIATASLLHYLGLSVQCYAANPDLSNGSDMVAFSNRGHIYVVECTTATPNNKGKLGKLHRRTDQLRKLYKEKEIGDQLIRPVLFSNLEDDYTTQDHDLATNYKISLFTKEKLMSLANKVDRPPNEDGLYRLMQEAIPEKRKEVAHWG